jgi:hypothetical protein
MCEIVRFILLVILNLVLVKLWLLGIKIMCKEALKEFFEVGKNEKYER